MKSVRKISRAQSLLLCLNLLVLFVILFHLKFADGSEHKTVHSNLNSIVESNYMSYLKSLDVLNPTNQETQKSQNLSSESTIILSNNLGHSQYPKIVADGPNVYTLWMDDTQGNRDIYFKRSEDNGTSFGETINLSTNPGGSLNPTMTASKTSSSLYVVWEHIPGNNGEIFFTRSTDNGEKFDSPLVIGNNTGLNGFPQVAMSEINTNVYVVWHDAQNGIMLRRSTDSGSTFEPPIKLGSRNVDSQNPQIAVSQDNNIYVAWQSNSQEGNGSIVFTRSTDNGESFENPITISAKNGNSVNPQVAVSRDNNVYLVWDNNASGNEEINLHKVNPKNMPLISSNLIHNDIGLQNITTINVPANNSKRIALVERTFTDAAYNNAFYLFYNTKRDTTSNISEYTNLLSSKVTKQYTILPEFETIVNHLKWLTPKSNITILTDADVHDSSSLFMANGTIKYNAVILGHNEYVTQLEYSNLRQFVASGGVLILLDGNVFYAEVNYDKKTQTITLVKGHRWEFDGTFASTSVDERWANETTEWVGSNYCECWGVDNIRFANNPFGVIHNEEQYITNPNAKIILDYQAYDVGESKFLPSDFKIATYELDYKKGKVITLGLYTDDLLFKNDKFKRFFDSLMYYYVFRE